VVFHILGSLVATRGSEVIDLGPAKQRTLLAVLLCRANSVVPTSDLVEALWPNGQPRTALKNLHSYACGLRKAVVEGGGCSLVYRAPGYQVSLEHTALDAAEFDTLTRQGRASLRAGNHGRAVELLGASLRLWRGPALAEFTESPLLRYETDRLAARRLEAYENLIEAHLALGSAVDLLDEVAELARAHPARERLRGLQMAALHQVGRQAEALAVYDEVRQELSRELGLSPSPALRQQYETMLAGHRPTPWAGAGQPTSTMLWLPRAIGDFVGRHRELDELLRVLDGSSDSTAPAVAVVHGPPGVGKTTLAVHAAHRLRAAYPDGRILVRLRDGDRGRRAPAAVFTELLRRLGADRTANAVHEEDRAGLLRALLADRRVLLVLDDATGVHTLHSLLPGTGASAAVVTSRRLLVLDSAHYMGLGPFTVPEAVGLLGRVIGTTRVEAAPDAAEQVVRAARLLPLAVRVAATTLLARPNLPLRASAVELQATAAVRAAVAELLDDLDADERRALADLAGRAGINDHTVTDGPVTDLVTDVAERLLLAHAVADVGTDRAPQYRLAELLAPFAGELVAPERARTGFVPNSKPAFLASNRPE